MSPYLNSKLKREGDEMNMNQSKQETHLKLACSCSFPCYHCDPLPKICFTALQVLFCSLASVSSLFVSFSASYYLLPCSSVSSMASFTYPPLLPILFAVSMKLPSSPQRDPPYPTKKEKLPSLGWWQPK